MTACYIDTSALAKWYLPESGSDRFEHYIRHEVVRAVIAPLVAVELRCLLARRRRAADFSADHERAAFARFERQVMAGHLEMACLGDGPVLEAVELITKLEAVHFRTLDAIHLAIALAAGVDRLATADKVMRRAGEALGLPVDFF